MSDVLTVSHRRSTAWSIALSLLMMACGVLAICVPVVAAVAVTAIVGALLALSGLLHLAFAWRGGRPAAVAWEALLGIAYAAVGMYLLIRPSTGVESVAIAVAIYLLIEGVLELALAFQLRPERGSGWLLVDGIVTLVLAVLVWSTWSVAAAWVVGTLAGISMLFSGISRLMLSMAVRQIVS